MSNPPPVNYVSKSTQAPESGIATLIPYRNVPALISYYLGIFSLFPFLGAPMGLAAVILGIMGLKKAAANPNAKGKVHAIVGIVCGAIFGLLWTAAIALMIFALLTKPMSSRL